MGIVSQTEDGVTLAIKVIPNASQNEVSGIVGEYLKVRVKSPPKSGKANEMACGLLAELFQVKKDTVSVIVGNTNPKKIVGIRGVSVDVIRNKLGL